MNKNQIRYGAALVGGILAASVSVFASTAADNYASQYKSVRTDVPSPSAVVNPGVLPRRYFGTTVRLSLAVDTAGMPRDIAVLSPKDPELAQSITKAVSQWRFTPALKKGVPVETRVELPLYLANSPRTPGMSFADPAGR